jgi:hypothetical protein
MIVLADNKLMYFSKIETSKPLMTLNFLKWHVLV